MRKALIVLVFIALLMPSVGSAKQSKFWVSLPMCIDVLGCEPFQPFKRCSLYLTIANREQAEGIQPGPIKIKLVAKHATLPNKKVFETEEFIQNESDKLYNLEDFSIPLGLTLLEVIIDAGPYSNPGVDLRIAEPGGDPYSPTDCHTGLPLEIHPIRRK